jgi:desampylase
MMVFVLPPPLRAHIASEAVKALPRECCGLIEGVRGDGAITATALHPARNAAEAADRFEIDPADHIRALKSARAANHSIVGCYHSHPDGRTEPSARDVEGASEEGFVWLVAALTGGAEPAIGAFLFDGMRFEPLRIVAEDRR